MKKAFPLLYSTRVSFIYTFLQNERISIPGSHLSIFPADFTHLCRVDLCDQKTTLQTQTSTYTKSNYFQGTVNNKQSFKDGSYFQQPVSLLPIQGFTTTDFMFGIILESTLTSHKTMSSIQHPIGSYLNLI